MAWGTNQVTAYDATPATAVAARIMENPEIPPRFLPSRLISVTVVIISAGKEPTPPTIQLGGQNAS
jgi:hypothetical protein